MASTIPVDQYYENIDLESLLHDIDAVCENATRFSSTLPVHCSESHKLVSKSDKRTSTSRQSTLDKFMGTTSRRTDNHNARDQNSYKAEEATGVKIDPETAKTWIYPANYNLRDYQFSICQAALFSNTLVVLPTGLGKTLIAAVVMYNYFRWFPEGKIVFAAPSRPLVTQQIKACHEIVGIPQEWTIEMTGQINRLRRADLWKAKRVFFLTPQVLEKDIQSGICLVKQLVCLVIDEAHRASGNYAYCVAVRELMAVPVELRILALSATPGSKQQEIQQIIDTLQISTLEYRNESDNDVKQYVHDRTVDLITVAMDSATITINNLLLEVIRPFVTKLCAYGVLPRRDIQTLSPCELLNSRESFRQAPPQGLAQIKYGEVEGSFTVLLTLYHIKKLLSSHGIRPAFDMLEDKLQNGSLSRFMSKNEALWRVKFLMQQSLSNGVPGPKLSKMLDVLIDHFKTNGPKDSRVIIFSNFRGSVRDILNALVHVGDIVKATEFIGQSSGKTLKGQSQKVQQAVLDKFRAGEYNVIVATSIGEEGLDIMEVDLVLCFDANVSPLRMIQRMGRTGRKSKGRVVVLCYEGQELNGYKQKQKKGNSIKKHMLNGGVSSFNFHSSPRMVPHIYKPEVQVIELAIEQYIPRGKKVRDDQPVHTPISIPKLTGAETNIIEKYFDCTKDITWKPSKIAFPHFQAFPSRVHKVMHSFRTGMLIDAMQHLQGSLFSTDQKAYSFEEEAASHCYEGVETVEQQHNSNLKEMQDSHDSPDEESAKRVSECDIILHADTSTDEEDNFMNSCRQDIQGENPPLHSYLFSSDFVSVDALGNVLVVSVPSCPLNKLSRSKTNSNIESVNFLNQKYFDERDSGEDYKEQNSVRNGREKIGEPLNNVENRTPVKEANESMDESQDFDLSPRLTNFIKSGVVPESPLHNTEKFEGEERREFMVPNIDSSPKLHADLSLNLPIPDEKELKEVSSIKYDVHALISNDGNSSPKRCSSSFQIAEEIITPKTNLSSGKCSQDWRISSGEKSQSVEQVRKFRRLRKYRDAPKKPPIGKDETNAGPSNLARSSFSTNRFADRGQRGEKKLVNDARFFIDEEAEVSQQVVVSDDEEEEEDLSAFEDSFIDDRINPTAANTQADDSITTDMMAIYRRSLLTQSPMDTLPSFSTEGSIPDSVEPDARTNKGSSSSAGTSNFYLQTPQDVLKSTTKIDTESMPCTSIRNPIENESRIIDTRKRKLSFYEAGSVPVQNLEPQFSLQTEAIGPPQPIPVAENEANVAVFDDDDDGFYASIDLAALEEEAAMLLRQKSEQLMSNKLTTSKEIDQCHGVVDTPSFDLGI